MKPRRVLFVIGGVILLAALVALGSAAFRGRGGADPAPASLTGEPPPQFAVRARGRVEPARWATLSSEAGGTVAELPVAEGDEVRAGDLVLRLDATDLEMALQIALQEVAAQQAALDRLYGGEDERAAGRAEREHAYQMAQSEIALRASRERLAQALAHDPARDVAAARADLEQLGLQIAQHRALDPSPEVAIAEVELERAQIALDDVQDEYTRALDRPWEPQSVRDALAKQVRQASLNLKLAQAQLARAVDAREAHRLGTDILEAQLGAAEVRLGEAVEAQQAYSSTLAIAQADVEAAQLDLEYLRAWENPHRDGVARAEVAQAEARLRQAELQARQIAGQVARAEVRAPYDGTIGKVNVRLGELVSPGQPVAVLGDLSTLRVETIDLDEWSAGKIGVGDEVDLVFDAFDDKTLTGHVTEIAVRGETLPAGDVAYQAIIELVEPDPELRWGMSVRINVPLD